MLRQVQVLVILQSIIIKQTLCNKHLRRMDLPLHPTQIFWTDSRVSKKWPLLRTNPYKFMTKSQPCLCPMFINDQSKTFNYCLQTNKISSTPFTLFYLWAEQILQSSVTQSVPLRPRLYSQPHLLWKQMRRRICHHF